eukprot:TRINITY_DN2766_c0_g1_i1.p1 TRINITY_DN2766_c0_g1~~TRINITY_DN2766_c0_g1_i1.p1  ORF type:complete len:214 (+),score=22.03 TRINITY_DN2766_c0_g1_i1:94-735(+)
MQRGSSLYRGFSTQLPISRPFAFATQRSAFRFGGQNALTVVGRPAAWAQRSYGSFGVVALNVAHRRDALVAYNRAISAESNAVVLYSAAKNSNKFAIHVPQVHTADEWKKLLTTGEKILFTVLGVLTFGLAIVFYYKPLLDYRSYAHAINKMRLDGRKLVFTGTWEEFRSITYKNYALNFVTLGFYSLWKQPELNIAHYLDSHIEWAPPRLLP